MQTTIKKVYLGIMVTILCLITLVTVTYAWVGFQNISSFERIDINLNISELEEYGIEISLTGKDGTFGSSVDSVELKKTILLNAGYTEEQLSTREEVEYIFSRFTLDQCSVHPNEDNSFPDFVDMDDELTKAYYKFDIYVSTYRIFDSGESDAEYFLDLYLQDDILRGTRQTRSLINKFTYPSNFVNQVPNGIQANTVIKDNVCVDSSSATRVAIQKYNVVEKYKPELYDITSNINDLIIYQGGTASPTYIDGVYSFGGIMEEQYNLALYDFNLKFPNRAKSVPEWAIERNDIVYNPSDTNQIISSSKTEERIGINQMMKMTIYFWFEGWDADCFDIIDRNPVTLSLNFSASRD